MMKLKLKEKLMEKQRIKKQYMGNLLVEKKLMKKQQRMK